MAYDWDFFASSVKCKLRQLWTKQALGLTVFKSADMLKNISYKYFSKKYFNFKNLIISYIFMQNFSSKGQWYSLKVVFLQFYNVFLSEI